MSGRFRGLLKTVIAGLPSLFSLRPGVPGYLRRAAFGSVFALCSCALQAQNQDAGEVPPSGGQQVQDLQVILLERVESLYGEVRALRGQNEVLRAESKVLRSQLERLKQEVAALAEKTKNFSAVASSPRQVVLPESFSGSLPEPVGQSTETGSLMPGVVPTSPRRQTGIARLVVDSSPRALPERASPYPGSEEGQGAAGSQSDDDRDYYLALAPLDSGDLVSMRQKLQEYVDTHRDGAHLASAWYWIGESWYEQGEHKKARLVFEQFLRDYPQHESYHDVRFKLAEIYHAQGEVRQAKMFLEALSGVSDERISAAAKRRLKMLSSNAQQ